MSEGNTPPGDSEALIRALGQWPEPAQDEAEWEESAEQVSARVAAGAKPRSSMGISDEDLFRAPLPQTKAEEERAGDIVGAAVPKEAAKPPASRRERDRSSLKELAKLANSTPPPAPVAAVEAPEPDSGVIDIPVIAEVAGTIEKPVAAPARSVAAVPSPARSKPTLPPELMPRLAPEPPRTTPVQQAAPPPERRKGAAGAWALFGTLAVAAAAGGVFLGLRHAKTAGMTTASEPPAPSPGAAATKSDGPHRVAGLPNASTAAGVASPPAPSAIPVTALAVAELLRAQPPGPGAATGGAAPKGPAGSVALASPPLAALDPKPSSPPSEPAAKSGNGAASPQDLNALMAQAVGASAAPNATPAAADSDPGQSGAAGNVPLKPSLGAIEGALGAVLPGARGCLGPDDAVSHATVTFRSDGSVQRVAITGGAVGTPAEGCIGAALRKAHIPPFAQPTFSSPVTIRPN